MSALRIGIGIDAIVLNLATGGPSAASRCQADAFESLDKLRAAGYDLRVIASIATKSRLQSWLSDQRFEHFAGLNAEEHVEFFALPSDAAALGAACQIYIDRQAAALSRLPATMRRIALAANPLELQRHGLTERNVELHPDWRHVVPALL